LPSGPGDKIAGAVDKQGVEVKLGTTPDTDETPTSWRHAAMTQPTLYSLWLSLA
jgi:hypothetical protein